MAYCTQTDLEYAVGGAAVLVQLLDKDGDGVADASYVTAILNRATAEANSAIQVAHDLSTITSPYPDALIVRTADVAAYYAFLEGTMGQGIPEKTRLMYEDAGKFFDQVAKGERTLGKQPAPATQLDLTEIDMNPNGDQVTRDSLKAFW